MKWPIAGAKKRDRSNKFQRYNCLVASGALLFPFVPALARSLVPRPSATGDQSCGINVSSPSPSQQETLDEFADSATPTPKCLDWELGRITINRIDGDSWNLELLGNTSCPLKAHVTIYLIIRHMALSWSCHTKCCDLIMKPSTAPLKQNTCARGNTVCREHHCELLDCQSWCGRPRATDRGWDRSCSRTQPNRSKYGIKMKNFLQLQRNMVNSVPADVHGGYRWRMCFVVVYLAHSLMLLADCVGLSFASSSSSSSSFAQQLSKQHDILCPPLTDLLYCARSQLFDQDQVIVIFILPIMIGVSGPLRINYLYVRIVVFAYCFGMVFR